MDRFTEILQYLLRERGDGIFSLEAAELRQAEQAVLIDHIQRILQEGRWTDEEKLRQITLLLREDEK